ncbi:hypothetical protein FH972_014408 [Carpinus fangiana]|uniref:Uncharacterized protein n=1 Tax=Carpinus fangiana TaxID=176857 RepID=A0A5N6R9J3_9ROSI|nr:hypothetical protein FH972_014408 [Carpinus fangiana]
MAALMAAQLCIEMGIRQVQLEGDAKNAIVAVNSGEPDESGGRSYQKVEHLGGKEGTTHFHELKQDLEPDLDLYVKPQPGRPDI